MRGATPGVSWMSCRSRACSCAWPMASAPLLRTAGTAGTAGHGLPVSKHQDRPSRHPGMVIAASRSWGSGPRDSTVRYRAPSARRPPPFRCRGSDRSGWPPEQRTSSVGRWSASTSPPRAPSSGPVSSRHPSRPSSICSSVPARAKPRTRRSGQCPAVLERRSRGARGHRRRRPACTSGDPPSSRLAGWCSSEAPHCHARI